MKKNLSIVLVLLLFVAFLANACKQRNTKETAKTTEAKTPVILVHSAWLGAWQWEATVKHLENDALTLITPDLPGHGKDTTPANEISMEDYVNHLLNIIDKQSEKVVLVGHSFNGITISRVAELRPKK